MWSTGVDVRSAEVRGVGVWGGGEEGRKRGGGVGGGGGFSVKV